MKTYTVKLSAQASLWAEVEVQAESEDGAASRALAQAARGEVSFESDFDASYASILDVQESVQRIEV